MDGGGKGLTREGAASKAFHLGDVKGAVATVSARDEARVIVEHEKVGTLGGERGNLTTNVCEKLLPERAEGIVFI